MSRHDAAADGALSDWHRRAYRTSKRILDLTVAGLTLAAVAPVILAAAAMVRLTSPGPALFRQYRVGQGEKLFTLLKLRTMRVDANDDAHRRFIVRELRGEAGCEAAGGIYKPADDPRVTPVGRFLRQFSIDELPQLLNVLRGEMSLVGPRPSLPWEVELYTAEQRLRHECLPGITGLWQVSGRNRRTMPEMLALDLAYLGSRSLLLDVWILLRTPYVVLFCRETR